MKKEHKNISEIMMEQNVFKTVDFSLYNNAWYDAGASFIKRTLWFFINAIIFKTAFIPFSGFKVKILRLFGAKIGMGGVIKPSVNIKYPWNLQVGDYVWIGENVWIDNLAKVVIGNNVCISQGAMLLCGNHNYKLRSFDLMLGDITLEDGVWVGAQSVVCPHVVLHSHAVLGVGSIAHHDLEPYTIYQGNPAIKIRKRVIVD